MNEQYLLDNQWSSKIEREVETRKKRIRVKKDTPADHSINVYMYSDPGHLSRSEASCVCWVSHNS